MVSTPCLSCHFLQNIRQLKSLGRLHYRLRRNRTLLDGFRRQGSHSSRVHVEVATFREEGEEGRGKREERQGVLRAGCCGGTCLQQARAWGCLLPCVSACLCGDICRISSWVSLPETPLSWVFCWEIFIRQEKKKQTPEVSYLGESCKVFLICKMRQKEERLFVEEMDFTSGDSGEPGQISFSLCREKWSFSFGGKLWGKIINLHRAINRI